MARPPITRNSGKLFERQLESALDYIETSASAGPQGETGLTGPVGPQGIQGEIGPTGPQGAAGPSGSNGLDGAPGADGAQGIQGPAGPNSPSLILQSGRAYCYTDLRWVTGSDDNYGTSYYQFNESGGTGLEPVVEWEHQGQLIPQGRTLRNLYIAGRCNNVELTDVQIYIVMKHPTPITRWQTGYDNDGEDVVTVLYNDLWMTPTGGGTIFTGATNDARMRSITLDHTVSETGYFSIYYKPVGALTANRYFLHNWTLEVE